MPDLTVLSATSSSSSSSSSSNRDNAGEGYETPPRGQLRGLGAADGFEWLYELDNCGDVYAVPLSSKHVASSGAELGSRHASACAASTRPSVWVQSADCRPVADVGAIARLLVDEPADCVSSPLGTLTQLNELQAGTRPSQAANPDTDNGAAHTEILLRLQRNTTTLEPRKRPREGENESPQRTETWTCRICSLPCTSLRWACLRNSLSIQCDESTHFRICLGCAAKVEAVMRDEVDRRAKAECAAARKPTGAHGQGCAWATKPLDEPCSVPGSMRDAVLAFITSGPRTLHELTAWLRLRMPVEEAAVASFVNDELGNRVLCTAITNRVVAPSHAAKMMGHLTLYSRNEDVESSSADEPPAANTVGQSTNSLGALARLWNS